MFTKIKELISGVTRNEQDVIIHGLQRQVHELNNTLSRTIKANVKKENTIVEILKLAESNKTPFAKKIADIARGDV